MFDGDEWRRAGLNIQWLFRASYGWKRAPSAAYTRRTRGESLVQGNNGLFLAWWAKATRAVVANMYLRRWASVT